MPIDRLLQRRELEPAEQEALRLALTRTLHLLGLVDRNDPICEIVARKIMEIGATGASSPVAISEIAARQLAVAYGCGSTEVRGPKQSPIFGWTRGRLMWPASRGNHPHPRRSLGDGGYSDYAMVATAVTARFTDGGSNGKQRFEIDGHRRPVGTPRTGSRETDSRIVDRKGQT